MATLETKLRAACAMIEPNAEEEPVLSAVTTELTCRDPGDGLAVLRIVKHLSTELGVTMRVRVERKRISVRCSRRGRATAGSRREEIPFV
jgi:hypothetical protein